MPSAKDIEYVRKLNKRLNERMKRAEKTKGSSLDLTKTPAYKRLQELAKQQGVKSTGKAAGARFKERGLEKLSTAQFEEIEKISKKAEMYKSPAKMIKETQRRFKKGGIELSAAKISDIVEAQKGSTWKTLKEFYASEQIIELIDKSGSTISLQDKIDIYMAKKAGKTFDADEFRDYVYTGMLE